MALEPWHNAISMEFLELYKNERIFWDPKHTHHKNKLELNEAWARIQSAMSINCSIHDLKRKKESLMASYRLQFYKKMNNPNEFRPTWFAFEFMDSFLGEKYESEYSEDKQVKKRENYIDYAYSNSLIREKKPPSLGIKRPLVSSSKKCSKNESIYNQKNVSGSYLRNTDEDIDDCELYGQLLARKLRRLDERQRDMTMHKIDNIIFESLLNNDNSQKFAQLHYDSRRKLKSPVFINAQPDEEYEETYLEDPMQDE